MSREVRAFYEAKVNATWPEQVPPMDKAEAEKAARALYRFAFKRACKLPVKVVSGRSHSYIRAGVLRVNPSKGWREVVHVLSHSFHARLSKAKPHSISHARMERDMAAHVVAKGWLDGKLKPAAKPKPSKQAQRYAATLAGIARWEAKAKRARNALAKLNARRKYYERAGFGEGGDE